jgi:hypothetical protein
MKLLTSAKFILLSAGRPFAVDLIELRLETSSNNS